LTLSGASRELVQHNDQIVMGYLEKLDRDDIVTRVRAQIVAGLGGGSFHRAAIADSLHTSASALQARLSKSGLSFQQMLDDTQRGLALGYIERSRRLASLSPLATAVMPGDADDIQGGRGRCFVVRLRCANVVRRNHKG